MSLQLQAVVALDHSKFGSGLSSISQLASNASSAMMMAFNGVTGEIFAMGKAFGPVGAAVATMKNVASAGMDIQQSMANIASLTSEGAAAIGKFGDIASQATRDTKFKFTEVAEAMQMFAAAGYESADAMTNILKPGLDLAAAGGTNTANAVSVMVGALKTFGLEATQATNVANLFAGGANVSMASVESLGEGMTYAGSVAAAYGMKLNETIGVLSLYADKGMQGSIAGTAFAQSMAALTKAANEGKTAIGQALAGWNPAAEGMQGAIKRLEESGISATQVLSEFGRMGGKSVASLLNSGAAAIGDYTSRVSTMGNATDIAAQRQNTLGGAMKDLAGEFQRVQVALYALVSGAMQAFVESARESVQWVVNLVEALAAGNWDAVKQMIAGVFDSIVASVKSFGNALPDTFAAIKVAVETLSGYFNSVKDAGMSLFSFLKNVDWANVLEKAIKLIDAALSLVISTITGVVVTIQGMITAWQNLSTAIKVTVGVITGTVGITVGLVSLITQVELAAKAIAALALAMKANLISHAETAYIKLMLMGDAIKAVTIAQAGMVAGAAALGVGLGLLIRQIPGVAEALDNMTVKVGQFLGLVTKEDQALKENLAQLKARRAAMDAAREAQASATVEITATNAAIGDNVMTLQKLGGAVEAVTTAMMPLAPAVREVKKEVVTATGFYDALQKSSYNMNSAMLENIITMRKFAPASQSMVAMFETISDNAANAVDPINKMNTALQDMSKINVGIKIELPLMTDMIANIWYGFFDKLKDVASRDIGISINLPFMTNALVSVWSSFFAELAKAADKAINIDIKLPEMNNRIVGIWNGFFTSLEKIADKTISVDIQLPVMTNSIASSWAKFFGVFKSGDLTIPEIGSMPSDISSIAKNLAVIAAAKGVLWA